MNPVVKVKWVQALRSGQYKQARKKLTDGGGFCCLGVLCNLHALETGGAWQQEPYGDVSYLGANYELPTEVREWADLRSCNPRVGLASLAEYNDGNEVARKSNFRTIAKLIEKHL